MNTRGLSQTSVLDLFCDFCAFCGSTALIRFIPLNTLPEFIDEVQDQTDDNADDNAGSQGKVKRYIIFFDQDVAGKLSHKGQSREDQDDEAGQHQDRPDNNHDLCYLAHDNIPDLGKPEQEPFYHGDTEVKRKSKSCCYEILHTSHCELCGLCG